MIFVRKKEKARGNEGMIRDFLRKQRSGILDSVKEGRYHSKDVSRNRRRSNAVEKSKRLAQRELDIKTGKIDPNERRGRGKKRR